MPKTLDVMPSFFYYELLAKYKELEAITDDKIDNAQRLHAEAVGRNAKLLRENADLRRENDRLRLELAADVEDFRQQRKIEDKINQIRAILRS